MVKGDPKTLRGKKRHHGNSLCELASRNRRHLVLLSTSVFPEMCSERGRPSLLKKRKNWRDSKGRACSLQKGSEDLQPSHRKNEMHIQAHQHTQAASFGFLVLSIPCRPQKNTLAYAVGIPEHLLLTTGEHPGLSRWGLGGGCCKEDGEE